MANDINWGRDVDWESVKSAAKLEKMTELQAAANFVKTFAGEVTDAEKQELQMATLGTQLGKLEDKMFFIDKKYMAGLKAKIGQEETKEGFPHSKASECLVYYPRHQPGGDYSDNTINPGELEYINLKSLLARFFITCHSHNRGVPNWREFCIGVISCSWDKRGEQHMPMFDFDGRNIKTHVKKQVKALQERHGLGDAWIYRTKRGLHVYFFTDLVSRNEYMSMLEESECCKGFRRAAENHGWGTLRVSAKFTKFDISFEYILRSKKRYPRRMVRKAHLVQELIRLGQECGTHFASLFPQWAGFNEDPIEWKQGTGAKKARRGAGYKQRTYDGNQYRSKKIKKVGAIALTLDVSDNVIADSAGTYKNVVADGTAVTYSNVVITTGTTTGSTNDW